MNYIIYCITKKYAVFKGRAGRKEYCYFASFCHLLNLLLLFLNKNYGNSLTTILCALLILLCIIPYFSLNIRRFHDINKSGWWFFISTIIPVGLLISFIALLFIKGTPGPNKYGEPPIN